MASNVVSSTAPTSVRLSPSRSGGRRDGDPVEHRDEQARRAGDEAPAVAGCDVERAIAEDAMDAGQRDRDQRDEDGDS